MVTVMIVLCGFCSFGVDLGRVQLVKTELRRVADAAARSAAAGIPTSRSFAISQAQQIAALNRADGSPVVLDANQDIQFGKWDKASRSFTTLSASNWSQVNAVRVIARRTAARGTAVPTIFAKVVGHNSHDVSAESIVLLIPAIEVDETIQATANPFLAGMPKGAVASLNNPHNSPDYAGDSRNPRQSPFPIKNFPLNEGASLTFDSIAGTARHDPNLPYFQPDGELGSIGRNTNGSENGISDLKAPINALVGVFLDDSAPNTSSAPASLDFSSSSSREFSRLQPKLKQLFFIGDGKTSAGAHQEFEVPRGATRLYLATWDFYEWNNNAGWRSVKISRPQQIITVK